MVGAGFEKNNMFRHPSSLAQFSHKTHHELLEKLAMVNRRKQVTSHARLQVAHLLVDHIVDVVADLMQQPVAAVLRNIMYYRPVRL